MADGDEDRTYFNTNSGSRTAYQFIMDITLYQPFSKCADRNVMSFFYAKNLVQLRKERKKHSLGFRMRQNQRGYGNERV